MPTAQDVFCQSLSVYPGTTEAGNSVTKGKHRLDNKSDQNH